MDETLSRVRMVDESMTMIDFANSYDEDELEPLRQGILARGVDIRMTQLQSLWRFSEAKNNKAAKQLRMQIRTEAATATSIGKFTLVIIPSVSCLRATIDPSSSDPLVRNNPMCLCCVRSIKSSPHRVYEFSPSDQEVSPPDQEVSPSDQSSSEVSTKADQQSTDKEAQKAGNWQRSV